MSLSDHSGEELLNIHDLFDEILIKIFLIADMKLSDIFTCTVVCKRWSEIMSESELWAYFTQRDFGSDGFDDSDWKASYLVALIEFEEEEERRRAKEYITERYAAGHNYFGNFSLLLDEQHGEERIRKGKRRIEKV
eukprot:TRINITY_DN5793_c0_g1_i1.p1 TRINITY_DN5793_c0_g1~~TRINITY_DN5793_c0_g1_i1.p1  ORF type:complete len:136 (-),score=30.16 TRINITY_DN5793_c0_g1_i1:567-974(-)